MVRFVFFGFLFLWMHSLMAYSIKGRVNLGEDWQPQIYMAAIEKLSDYYRASADLIINVAAVDANGNFVLEGNNLPNDARFYRLYLIKEQNTEYDVCVYVGGDDHNFVHIVLDNASSIALVADTLAASPFGNYEVRGDYANQCMRELAHLVYPSFNFYKIKFPSELRLSEEKLHYDLKNFVDTTGSTIAALAAINNINFDEFFEQDKDFYTRFSERLQRDLTSSNYTQNYLRKLSYYAHEVQTSIPRWFSILVIVLILLLVICMGLIIRLQYALKHARASASIPATSLPTVEDLLDRLTTKEREILEHIRLGKSNKEIASELFVELSTVKSHINKLYTKLNVSNRKEAIKKAKTLERQQIQ